MSYRTSAFLLVVEGDNSDNAIMQGTSLYASGNETKLVLSDFEMVIKKSYVCLSRLFHKLHHLLKPFPLELFQRLF
jgi:hypothetical protein